MTPHRLRLRVYYEDTDLAGLVYYANYLKFIERARSEWVRTLGLDQRALQAQGLVFAVRRLEADYLAPARFDDELRIETVLEALTPARARLRQQALRGEELLFDARVTLVALDPRGRPRRLPPALLRLAEPPAAGAAPDAPQWAGSRRAVPPAFLRR